MATKNRLLKLLCCLLIVAIGVTTTGCSHNLNMTLYGTPNSKVFDSKGEYIGQIASNGVMNVSLNRYESYDLLFTQNTDGDPLIPVGLDYSKRNSLFREIMVGILFFPTVGISAWAEYVYCERMDVGDGLKLDRPQYANTGFIQAIDMSPNPIDEIRALTPRAHKSGAPAGGASRQPAVSTDWINKTGRVSEIISFASESRLFGGKKSSAATGSILFGFSDSRAILVKAELNGNEFKKMIVLKDNFKKKGNVWTTTDNDGMDVEISFDSDGNACLKFSVSPFPVTITFDPSKFTETSSAYDEIIMSLFGF